MSRKCVRVMSILLAILVAHSAYPSPALAGDKAEKEVQFAQKAKIEIARLGTGPDAQVEVKLRDKTKRQGPPQRSW